MGRWRASTVVRLAGYYSLAFTLVTLLLGAGVYWAVRRELAYDLDQRIKTDRIAILREAREPGLAAVIAARAAHGSTDMRYALVGADGRVAAGQKVASVPAPGWSDMDFLEAGGVRDATRVFASRASDGGMLVIGADPEAIEELAAHLVPLFAVAFGLIAAIGVGGAILFGRTLSKRLGAINGTAEAIIAGDLAQRIPVAVAGDAFDQVAATLNRMLDRIEALLDNLRQVSGDIAHDLRTPLTRLRQTLELGLAGSGSIDDLRGAMTSALDHSDEALELFAGILAISEVEAKSGLRMAAIDLSQLVGDLADSYQPSIEDGGRAFKRRIAPDVGVAGNRELLAQMIGNLLDNALRHTSAGVPIEIGLDITGGDTVLVVGDHGAGIPADRRDAVFERFARLERSRSTPGHGLGLSLVAAVARAHGGIVRINDNHPGVQAMVTLPRSAA